MRTIELLAPGLDGRDVRSARHPGGARRGRTARSVCAGGVLALALVAGQAREAEAPLATDSRATVATSAPPTTRGDVP